MAQRVTPRQWVSVVAGAAVIVAAIGVYLGTRSSASPSSSPSTAHLAGHVPFTGTPADKWKDASVGLTMPAAVQEGPYPAAEVARALARTRAYLLAAHTSTAVLESHDLTSLRQFVTTGTTPTPQHLYAVELAPGNTLAAAPRLTGTVQVAFVPRAGTTAEHLEVTTNLLWAYALTATYPVYFASDGVVTLHEDMKLDLYLDGPTNGAQPRITTTRDESLLVNGDCAYFDADLVALPRVHDPKRVGGSGSGASSDQYNLKANVKVGGIGCV